MKIGAFIIFAAILILLAVGAYLLTANQNAMVVSPDSEQPDSGSQQPGNNQQPDSGSQQPNDPSGTFPEQTPPKTYRINIQDYAFSPNQLTIQAGDTVIWTNLDSVVHTVTSDSGNELSSSGIGNGQTYSHTFNTVGTFSYHCGPHPFMRGTISVD